MFGHGFTFSSRCIKTVGSMAVTTSSEPLGALEKPVSIGKAYNVTGEDVPVWEFATAWKAAGGRTPALMIPLPLPAAPSVDHRRATQELGAGGVEYR